MSEERRRDTTDRLARIETTLGYIDKSMVLLAECFKQCKITEAMTEQKSIRDELKWIKRVGISIAGVFGLAIVFLFMGHPVVFQKFMDKFFK